MTRLYSLTMSGSAAKSLHIHQSLQAFEIVFFFPLFNFSPFVLGIEPMALHTLQH